MKKFIIILLKLLPIIGKSIVYRYAAGKYEKVRREIPKYEKHARQYVSGAKLVEDLGDLKKLIAKGAKKAQSKVDYALGKAAQVRDILDDLKGLETCSTKQLPAKARTVLRKIKEFVNATRKESK